MSRPRLSQRLHQALERRFPEQRLFLRSDTETRFIRLSSGTQFIALTGSAAVIGWAIIASAILFMDSLGSGSLRDQAQREQALYAERLNALSDERDRAVAAAHSAHERFSEALAQVSEMQGALLATEERRKELEDGLRALQLTLADVTAERDLAQSESVRLFAELQQSERTVPPELARLRALEATVDRLSAALTRTAADRDSKAETAKSAETLMADFEFDRKLIEERNDRIFRQLEEAVAMSLEPLDDMFRSAGLPADSIIETVRRGYSGQGGPLSPIVLSTKGEMPDPDSLRANQILERLDELNLYRIAVQKTPFAEPVRGAYRYTSGFGPRRDPINGTRRMHNGSDFAARHGTPIHATADGTVTFAGWQSGYGRVIKIRHDFGIETVYAHLARIRVSVGERVSRDDRIGDMGNSGRSTGTHLHYEVRIDGNPVNPMKYIKAARDVF